jgi:hypothetical protein
MPAPASPHAAALAECYAILLAAARRAQAAAAPTPPAAPQARREAHP